MTLAANLEILGNYPKEIPLRVYCDNVGYETKTNELLNAYEKEVKGILNIVLDKNGKENAGTGYFIMNDLETATTLLHF